MRDSGFKGEQRSGSAGVCQCAACALKLFLPVNRLLSTGRAVGWGEKDG